jgi:hypothetical protein
MCATFWKTQRGSGSTGSNNKAPDGTEDMNRIAFTPDHNRDAVRRLMYEDCF